MSDDRNDRFMQVLDESLVVPAGGFLLLYADGMPEHGPGHLDFKLSKDGGDVALFEPDGDGQVIAYPAVDPDWSLARVPDCCTGSACIEYVFRGTPGSTNGTADTASD